MWRKSLLNEFNQWLIQLFKTCLRCKNCPNLQVMIEGIGKSELTNPHKILTKLINSHKICQIKSVRLLHVWPCKMHLWDFLILKKLKKLIKNYRQLVLGGGTDWVRQFHVISWYNLSYLLLTSQNTNTQCIQQCIFIKIQVINLLISTQPNGEIMQNGAGQQGILGHKFSPPAMQTPHPQRGLQPHEQLDISPSSL